MIHQFLAFASDGDMFAAVGAVCWVVAGIALVADRRRQKRRDLNHVGWVPWTGVFLGAALAGAIFLTLGLKASVAG